MGEMADASMNWEIDEHYEDRLIATLYSEGMSISAIGAKLNLPFSDVIESLRWSNSLVEERDV